MKKADKYEDSTLHNAENLLINMSSEMSSFHSESIKGLCRKSYN